MGPRGHKESDKTEQLSIAQPMKGTQETWFQSLGWKDSLEKETATYSSILAWNNPMDRGGLWATVHGIAKNRT